MSKSICVMPWINIATETNGKCKVCCVVMAEKYIKKDDGTDFAIQSDSIEEIFNSTYLKDLRAKMLRGDWPEDCSYCQKQEAVGNSSPRIEYTSRWSATHSLDELTSRDPNQTMLPISLEPRPGTLCNLKCNSCWSMSSSKVFEERKAALEGKYGPVPKFLKSAWQYEIEIAEASNFNWASETIYLDNVRKCMPGLKRLYFTGGEPALIKSNRELLRELLKADRRDLLVSFTTNLTWIDDELLDLASQFERFEMNCSIDGYGATNEYLRFPSRWDVIEKNLAKIIERNFTVSIMSVVQISNIFSIADLARWLARFPSRRPLELILTQLQFPHYLQSTILPTSLKDQARRVLVDASLDTTIPEINRQRIKRCLNHLDTEPENSAQLRKQFREYTIFQDKMRGTSFTQTFPRLASLLDETPQPSIQTRIERSQSFCVVPWMHTFMYPSGERRLCCVSEDPSHALAERLKVPLEKYWNSEDLKSTRLKMLSGQEVPACRGCKVTPHTPDVYKNYFNDRFGKSVKETVDSTEADGTVDTLPISFDYRTSNTCNFKCRMCGSDYSSSFEFEFRQNGLEESLRSWMVEPEASQVKSFQRDTAEAEFMQILSSGHIREIYWAGGEPLAMARHWQAMQELVNLGFAERVFVRYNTNLSRIDHRGKHLMRDLLVHFKGFQINASIDATGLVGEYLRTGLRWEKWRANLLELIPFIGNDRRIIPDITLTLPGLIDLVSTVEVFDELDLEPQIKHVQTNGANDYLSPLALPRPLLHKLVNETLSQLSHRNGTASQVAKRILHSFYSLSCFEETHGASWPARLRQTKQSCQELELVRREEAKTSMTEILSRHDDLLAWWTTIGRECQPIESLST